MKKIRKISIAVVAHIDHGKSTFCDAIIELCNGKKITSSSPSLDDHYIEKARGVTIRNHFIRLKYKDTIIYLIDTPGHYDFAQYVKIGIQHCDSVIMLTDITKGVQAQTISHMRTCKNYNKTIFPVINKIDLGIRDKIEEIKSVLKENLNTEDFFEVSAKTRENTNFVFESIIKKTIEKNTGSNKLKFTILDCVDDKYIGKILFIKVVSGSISKNSRITLFNKIYIVTKLELKENIKIEVDNVSENDFCYLYSNITQVPYSSLVGTTFEEGKECAKDELKPLIFSNIIPSAPEQHERLKKSIEKTLLGDQSVTVEHLHSKLYGNIFRCGFFGDFHKTIFFDRIKIENNIDFKTSPAEPLLRYKTTKKLETYIDVDKIKTNYKSYLSQLEMPFTRVVLSYNGLYHNKLISCLERNITNYKIIDSKFYLENFYVSMLMLSSDVWEKFTDMAKSSTNGYIDISVDGIEYKSIDLAVCEFSINREIIEEFTFIDSIERANKSGLEKLKYVKNILDRQQFEITLNMSINKKVFAKEVIKPYRKDVTAKLYGGDSTRRKKLLKKQSEGKKGLLKNANISELKAQIISYVRSRKN